MCRSSVAIAAGSSSRAATAAGSCCRAAARESGCCTHCCAVVRRQHTAATCTGGCEVQKQLSCLHLQLPPSDQCYIGNSAASRRTAQQQDTAQHATALRDSRPTHTSLPPHLPTRGQPPCQGAPQRRKLLLPLLLPGCVIGQWVGVGQGGRGNGAGVAAQLQSKLPAGAQERCVNAGQLVPTLCLEAHQSAAQAGRRVWPACG